MKVYRKDETDVIFGEWKSDLAQLDTLDAIIIPKGATNGDVIKAMFPNCEVRVHEFTGLKCGVDVKFYLCENVYFTAWFTTDWWNAPYKEINE